MSLIQTPTPDYNCRLKCDVFKGGKHGKDGPERYGKKRDIVRVISASHPVVIVKGLDKNRYPVLNDEIEQVF